MLRRWMDTPPVPSSSGRYQPGLLSGAKEIGNEELMGQQIRRSGRKVSKRMGEQLEGEWKGERRIARKGESVRE